MKIAWIYAVKVYRYITLVIINTSPQGLPLWPRKKSTLSWSSSALVWAQPFLLWWGVLWVTRGGGERRNKDYQYENKNRLSYPTWLLLTFSKNPNTTPGKQCTMEYIAMTGCSQFKGKKKVQEIRDWLFDFNRYWKGQQETNTFNTQRKYGQII